MPRLPIDGFTLALVATVAAASVLPVSGTPATVVHWVADIAIAWLFFLHGARLPREAVISGITHWRLHLLVFLLTYALFPVLGLAVTRLLGDSLLPGPLATGVLFLCVLPSTVQSSIAFTSIAKGNVPAAICSATLSNLSGIVLTPLLVAILLNATGAEMSLDSVETIAVQLLLPFVLGQALSRWVGPWAARNKKVLQYTDRSSVLLVVYLAFSEAVIRGLWHQVPPASLAVLLAVSAAILAVVMIGSTLLARRLGFSLPDEAAIVFCGSKKSLISGVPMAGVLFSPATIGMVLLPVMIFHQLQLMVCAVVARRFAERAEAEASNGEPVAVRP